MSNLNVTGFDIVIFREFLEKLVKQYENTAPTVAQYCDDLYIRVGDRAPVNLEEIIVVTRLLVEPERFESPNIAANQLYKLQNRLGQDTTGHAGY